MSDLHQTVKDFAKTKNKKDAMFGIIEKTDNYILADQSDGRGPYIEHWGSSLGPAPTEADGFSIYHVHAIRA